jgi:hypothetical protein
MDMAIEAIRIPKSYRVETHTDGSTRMIHEPSPSEFIDEVITHILRCKEFKLLASWQDPCCLRRGIRCNCGARWLIDEIYLRNYNSTEMRHLLLAVEDGFFSESNFQFRKIISEKRATYLKKKIVSKMKELEAMKASIEGERKRKTIQRLKHPLFSLEVG